MVLFAIHSILSVVQSNLFIIFSTKKDAASIYVFFTFDNLVILPSITLMKFIQWESNPVGSYIPNTMDLTIMHSNSKPIFLERNIFLFCFQLQHTG